MPKVTEGEEFSLPNEVIASDSLKDDGFKIGDELQLSSSEEVLTIVGFTDKARFNAAPVLYSDLCDFPTESNSEKPLNVNKEQH